MLCNHSNMNMILCMDKNTKILQLTNKKDRKVSLMFNNELWEKFQSACEQDNIKVTHKLESLMINFIEEKGLL